MLTQLTIQNYTVADHLEMEFTSGMTAITGETGAGKSIMLDALNLALGARGDSKVIRKGESQATIAAVFDIESIPAAQQWLQQRALLTNDELNNGECILRRSIHTNGRSKAWINGQIGRAHV